MKYEVEVTTRTVYEVEADSYEEAIEKWNDRYCPEEFRREWGECGENESLVMVIHKRYVKFYM